MHFVIDKTAKLNDSVYKTIFIINRRYIVLFISFKLNKRLCISLKSDGFVLFWKKLKSFIYRMSVWFCQPSDSEIFFPPHFNKNVARLDGCLFGRHSMTINKNLLLLDWMSNTVGRMLFCFVSLNLVMTYDSLFCVSLLFFQGSVSSFNSHSSKMSCLLNFGKSSNLMIILMIIIIVIVVQWWMMMTIKIC